MFFIKWCSPCDEKLQVKMFMKVLQKMWEIAVFSSFIFSVLNGTQQSPLILFIQFTNNTLWTMKNIPGKS